MKNPNIKKTFLVLSGIAFSCVLVAAQNNNTPTLPGDPLKGRKILKQKGCVNCHTLWNIGKGVAPDLVKVSKGKTVYQLVGDFWNHSPRMVESIIKQSKKIPKFKPKEIENLFSFIYYLNYYDEPGNASRGEKVFNEKQCVVCHGVGTVGGDTGPPLDPFGSVMSPIVMAQHMWNHSPKMQNIMRSRGISVPTLSGQEIADLLSFIRSHSKANRTVKEYAFPGNPKKGRTVFLKKCVYCHSVHGEGGELAPDLGESKLQQSASDIAAIMWNHSNWMLKVSSRKGISYPYLSGHEMADVIAYVYFTGFLDPAGNVKKGKQYFNAKKCINCHPVGETAGGVATNLAESKTIDSPFHLAATMWNHLQEMGSVMKTVGVAWPKFEGDEMRDMVAYLRMEKEKKKTKTK